ncbi:hypothetical protein G7045_08775 [Acidovorax sp. HDW3]|uniref:hypothetical protein n=1 Tax=Acidovorax sp. HDW3 TaxID=2714923 RepID=UPI00140789FA|nr:hypothetical protein [Acidovorax sp. HDW3]QIL44345.1 hypothetical protein G7045_08775 [Acidovorax sp. HDW3]
MLTPIEWWGGLIFVVGALTYRMVMGALETEDEGIPWYRLQMHAFYLLPAVVLAGYFYPLERTALQYAYLAVLAASLVMVLVMLAQELTGDTSEDEAPPAEAEASDGWASVLGAVVLYSPVLVACGLGCTKAWPMVQGLV